MKLTDIRKQADLYVSIKSNDAPRGEYFFAFSNEQFDKGMEEIRKTSQEQVFKADYGMFGTRKGIDEFYAHYNNLSKRISEQCTPLGIFYYEYSNHEGDYGGDEAWEITREYFPDFDFSTAENEKIVKAIKEEWWEIHDRNWGVGSDTDDSGENGDDAEM